MTEENWKEIGRALRKFFTNDSREVTTRSKDATIWRIAPPGNNPPGESDVDFIRIYPTKHRRE
jgi:hypothetical protein